MSTARDCLKELVDRMSEDEARALLPVVREFSGRRPAHSQVAGVDAEDAEDLADVRTIKAQMAATGEQPVPWEVAKRELGL